VSLYNTLPADGSIAISIYNKLIMQAKYLLVSFNNRSQDQPDQVHRGTQVELSNNSVVFPTNIR
jgi:hypothetical protein